MPNPHHMPSTRPVRRGLGFDRRQRQSGFSLFELSLALALIGILMGMALSAQGLVEQYRQSQFVNHVRVLQSNLEAYRHNHGRWPGDCDGDGLMDYTVLGSETPDDLDYAVPLAFTPAAGVYTLGDVCPSSTLNPYPNLNVAYNELKLAGQTPAGQPNRLSAANQLAGTTVLGNFNVTLTAVDGLEDHFNAIVLTGVPISSARKLAVAIDGFDGSQANQNRVRRSTDLQTFDPLWTASGETEDTRITVAVFFDRIPPTLP
jgi:prepilin-type N-terminal cleavage/methylation domain-containing protein